jgi:hypothetical protein
LKDSEGESAMGIAMLKGFIDTVLFSTVFLVMPTFSFAQQNCSDALIVETYSDSSESSRDYRLSKYVKDK